MANSNQQIGENPQPGQIFSPTRATVSWIDSALLLGLRLILPLLFLTTLLIAGTLAISYTFYLHRQLPEHFTLAISVTFGLLIIFTAGLLILFYVRRIDKRRASIDADPEANRPLPTGRFAGTGLGTRGKSPHLDDGGHDQIRSSRSELVATSAATPSLRGGEQPRTL